jgi:hypothetical protein
MQPEHCAPRKSRYILTLPPLSSLRPEFGVPRLSSKAPNATRPRDSLIREPAVVRSPTGFSIQSPFPGHANRGTSASRFPRKVTKGPDYLHCEVGSAASNLRHRGNFRLLGYRRHPASKPGQRGARPPISGRGRAQHDSRSDSDIGRVLARPSRQTWDASGRAGATDRGWLLTLVSSIFSIFNFQHLGLGLFEVLT